MIKMVIFCVIAFALTWLPLNSLIIVADIYPVYELPGAMYIFMCAHYLAMCHTITNPLIYIWMNNRFRAGFKQVTTNICSLIRRWLALGSLYFCWPIFVVACSMDSFEQYRDDLHNAQAKRKLLKSGNGVANRSTVCINMTTNCQGQLRAAFGGQKLVATNNHHHQQYHQHHSSHDDDHHYQTNHAVAVGGQVGGGHRASCSASAATTMTVQLPKNYSQPEAMAFSATADSMSLDTASRQACKATEPSNQFRLTGANQTAPANQNGKAVSRDQSRRRRNRGLGAGGGADNDDDDDDDGPTCDASRSVTGSPIRARLSTASFNYDSDYQDSDLVAERDGSSSYSKAARHGQAAQPSSLEVSIGSTTTTKRQAGGQADLLAEEWDPELDEIQPRLKPDTDEKTTTTAAKKNATPTGPEVSPKGAVAAPRGARRPQRQQRRKMHDRMHTIRIRMFGPPGGEKSK